MKNGMRQLKMVEESLAKKVRFKWLWCHAQSSRSRAEADGSLHYWYAMKRLQWNSWKIHLKWSGWRWRAC